MRCIGSVLSQTYKDLEILVFDDNSETPLGDGISKAFDDERIICIRSDVTLGVAGGRNKLIEKARGEFLLTLDDDAILKDDGAIERLIGLFEALPDVGLFAMMIVDIVNGRQAGLRIPFPKSDIRKNAEIVNTPQYVSYFLGGGHAVRAEVFEKCGPYQSNLLFGCEELDLAYRMLDAGYKIFYTPDVVVEHYPCTTRLNAKAAERQYSYFLMRNKIWINYKYLPWFACLVNTTAWCLIRLILSFRAGGFFQVIRGWVHGFAGLGRLRRTPINSKTIAYLRENHGRIFL